MQNNTGDKQRLLHILDAITEIESYTKEADIQEFMNNSMMRFASIKQIEIIGEAANNISQAVQDQFSEIQWNQIIGMRNVMVHEYFGVATNLVWQVILTDLPELKIKIAEILSGLPDP